MITGTIKNQIDQIWNAFWSGGIANPLEVIEQITYLLFLRRLDDLHTLEENKAARLNRPMERRTFPVGFDGIGLNGGRAYEDLRWSRFKHFAPGEMYTVLAEHVFPFLRTLGVDDSTYAHHMNPKGIRKQPLGELIRLKSGDFLPAAEMAESGTYPVLGGNGISGFHDQYKFEEPQIVIGRVGAYCLRSTYRRRRAG